MTSSHLTGALLLFAVLANPLAAQQAGIVSGIIRDRSANPIASAEVRLQNEETGARQTFSTNPDGRYSTTALSPSIYKITVRRDGFRTTSKEDIPVIAGKIAHVDFTLDLLPLQQEVTVSAAQSDIDPTASGLTISRETPSATLPQNGRDVHALFDMLPGATVAPASISAGGQFTVSGQRPNANSFWIDGVSGNVGMGLVSTPGAVAGASLPGMTTIGGLQSLAAKEETDRVELRSADFSAEFGDRPGAQISITTRAGDDEFHGSLFGYLRPHALDSLDWFARGSGLDLPSASLDGFGFTLGGPLWRKHTFFFASLEKTNVHDSAVQQVPVPSLAARANPALAPYLSLFDVFPQPQGRTLNANEALGYSPLDTTAGVLNESLRLDQLIGNHIHAFARYSFVPSNSSNAGLGEVYSKFEWGSFTAGLNLSLGNTLQEFRFNYSNVSANSQPVAQETPSVPLITVALGARFFAQVTRLSMEGAGQVIAGASAVEEENQFAGTYKISRHSGKHEVRAGFDYTVVQQHGQYGAPVTAVSIASPGIDALLAGVPLGITASVGASPDTTPRFSAFLEDSFRLTDRLHLLLGMRWDVTSTYLTNYNPASFFIGYWNGVGSTPVQISDSLSPSTSWPIGYGQVEPRVGLAYHLKSPDLVLRAGSGLFYDTGLGAIIGNTNPLNIWQFLPNGPTPTVESLSSIPNSVLSTPRVWEWKVSLEKSLWEKSLLSVSYFGSRGSHLLRSEGTVDPKSDVLTSVGFTTDGSGNYNSLLAIFHVNITPNFFALTSYTWGHSIDNGSSDTIPVLFDGPANKGSSSFDVRQVLSSSLGYRTPQHLGRWLGGWTLSSTIFARTGFPFDVTTVDQSLGLGFDNTDHANLLPGQPIWISGSSFPGGRALNPAAFQLPTAEAVGNLGRNAITGLGLFQIDTSLRRQIRLYRGTSVEAVVSAFNLLNQPSFANPVSYLGSGLFGQSTSMTSLMLGTGSPTTGLTPLFQAGGPRTVELSLRFSF